jgi:hypothetical protein
MAGKLASLRCFRWWWLFLPVGVAAVCLFLLPHRRPRFGEDQFRRLSVGMTEAEVLTILGCPPGDYRPAIWSHPDRYVSTSDLAAYPRIQLGLSFGELERLRWQDTEDWETAGEPVPPAPARVRRERWWARGSGIHVAFDQQGRAVHLSLWGLLPPRPPPAGVRWVRLRLGW